MNFAASLFCQCLRLVVHIWLFSTILWWSWVWNLNCTFWISGYHLNVALNYESHLKIENIINHRSWNCTIFGAPFQIHLYLSSMVSHSIYISLHKTHSTNNLQYAHLNRDAYKYTQFWYENRMTNRLADWLCEYERIRHDTTHTHKKITKQTKTHSNRNRPIEKLLPFAQTKLCSNVYKKKHDQFGVHFNSPKIIFKWNKTTTTTKEQHRTRRPEK